MFVQNDQMAVVVGGGESWFAYILDVRMCMCANTMFVQASTYRGYHSVNTSYP